nr:protein GAMETE EXPRESSED 1 [Ipomoea batatas]
MGQNHKQILLLWFLMLLSQSCLSWGGWFFGSGKKDEEEKHHFSSNFPEGNQAGSKIVVSGFSMEPFNNAKGIRLVENARQKMLMGADSCWQMAYQTVFAECSKALHNEELRSRLAWHLSDCFQKHSGRPAFPFCHPKSPMNHCLKTLDDLAQKVYLEFFLETNSICHQLQMDAFKYQTERLVNELKRTAENAEEKIENIEERGEVLLQNSKEIHDSLSMVDLRTQNLEKASKNVEEHVDLVLAHSKAIQQQSRAIEASQKELTDEQARMKGKLVEGMEILQASYSNLDREINELRSEAEEIEKEIGRVGEEMYSKMRMLQSKADDIGNIAGDSLDKQKELLDSQSVALEGLHVLTKFQSQALEESRGTLQQLAETGTKQQEELLRRQEQLQQAHDHLVENSKTILAAQEAFESKQASMFVAIDKLFALHNAILLESRLMKAFLVYSLSIFLLYMFTSTKQTYNVRPRLYIGLCATFLIEFCILRYGADEIEQQSWMISMVRSVSVAIASIQLLYAIWTYRDYEMLNHQMLLTLMEKVNGMQKHKKESSWEEMGSDDSDGEVEDWGSWIENELAEEVDKVQDPDYLLPEEAAENYLLSTDEVAGDNGPGLGAPPKLRLTPHSSSDQPRRVSVGKVTQPTKLVSHSLDGRVSLKSKSNSIIPWSIGYKKYFGVENILVDCQRYYLQLVMSLRRPPLPRLLLKNVACMRNAQQILRHVNVSLHDGGALVLTGTNGSGKSTFLRMLAGFAKPSAGEILWNGHDITNSGVFEQYKLQLNWLSLKDAVKEKFTVLDNVQWFEVLEGKQGKSLPALELVGLGRLANDKARMLSMGQRKRLQLARLLAIDRPIWLLDEPSVALDDDGVKLLETIIGEHRKKGGIVIVATHLPITIEDAMHLRLPPRFPRRMTLVDMLDRGGLE